MRITDSAAEAVRMMVASERGATGGGVRLTLPVQPGQAVHVNVVAGPEADDHEIEHLGARVYFPPRTAAALHGKTLGAGVRGGRYELRLNGGG